MGVQRSNSVKVADVVIPQRLLSTNTRNRGWNRGHRRTENIDDIGPLEAIIRDAPVGRPVLRRPRSFSVTSDAREDRSSQEVILRRPRKTSDPVTIREADSVRSSCVTPINDLHKPRVNFDDTEPFPPLYEPPAEREETRSRRPSSSSTEGTDTSSNCAPEHVPQRSGTVKKIVHAVVPQAVQQTARDVVGRVRRSSIHEVYEKAKQRGAQLERKRWAQLLFEYGVYVILLSFVYFVLIGMPLWKGAVYWLYWVVQNKFVLTGGWAITIGVAVFYAFGPLLIFFEREPPVVEHPAGFDRNTIPGVDKTALLIPCYKSAKIIGPTLEAALKVFPAKNVFVIANGNSETPLDNTEEVCRPYGVNHIWSPVGSKIVAQFVGCYAAKGFRNVLLIDDDCAIPPNFPIVSERLVGKVKCIGYTIKSVGPNSSKGTWCTQAQDLEYKISGLQRALAGKMGSATFPHGAISLWNRKFLIETFHDHPGFSVSEDWFFGHSCRRLGGRIKMCTSVFVETETPDSIFFSSGGDRGGFGEMTVFKQRFLRWNFFFVNGMLYDLGYILFSWRLGWWEIGAKLFVFQEVYETLLYLFTPFILPISFIVNASFCGYLLLGTLAMYLVNVVIFNEVHLRMRKERVSWTMLLVYYMPYKLVLTFVNVGSCYWSLYKYAQYFAKPHLKIVEDEKAVGVVMRLEEELPVRRNTTQGRTGDDKEEEVTDDEGGRRMFVTAVGKRISIIEQDRSLHVSMEPDRNARLSFIAGAADVIPPTSARPKQTFDGQRVVQEMNSATFPTLDSCQESDEYPQSARRGARGRKTSWSQSPV